MEIDEKNKYISKINLALKNKIRKKILRAEKINNNKNNNQKYIMIDKNIKKQKDMKDKIFNEKVKYKFINRIKEIQNNSSKLNHSNIATNNSFHRKNFNNALKEEKKINVCNTIEIKNKYKNFIDSQKTTFNDSEKFKYIEHRNNSIDNSNIIINNLSLKNEFNENNIIFNKII